MRDKARIRKFCDELATLWENKSPNMRFGQIVVSLNQALDKPRHDIFCLEEEEMIEVLQRFFSKEYKKSLLKDNKRELLIERWEEAIEELRYNSEWTIFDLPLFRELLIDTWQYFINTIDDFGVNNRDLPIIGMMYVLVNRSNYPSGILMWEYDAYVRILEGFLLSLQEPLFPGGYKGNFYDGYITVIEYIHREYAFHISQFDSYFKELSEMYYEEYYSDTYDENGKEWEEDVDDE